MFPNVQIVLNFQIFILIFDNTPTVWNNIQIRLILANKYVFPTEYYKRPGSTLKCVLQLKFEWNLRTLNINIIFLSTSVKYKSKFKNI